MIFNSFKLKKYFPKSIFGRFATIIIVPLILSQFLYIYIFFERYLNKNNLMASKLLSQEISIISNEFDKEYDLGIEEHNIIKNLKKLSIYPIFFTNNVMIDSTKNLLNTDMDFVLFRSESYLVQYLSELKIKNDIYFIKYNKKLYNLYIKKQNGFLKIDIDRDRIILVSPRLLIFWSVLSTCVLVFISFIFMKNQIKSIKALTQTMRDYSILEKDNEYFIPKGAREIREIGQAFLKMQKEIKKYVSARTIMLAEISHDLRTPLTRINLEVEFLEDENVKVNIKKDVKEMQSMIEEYLMFARGENEEILEEVDIFRFFNNIIQDYKRSGYTNISLQISTQQQVIELRKNLFKRAINNIINNSLKYAKKIILSVNSDNDKLKIVLEDDGPGISEELYSKIMQPFFKVSNDKENIGLGLAITKNIIYKHRGKINFKRSKNLNGFCVEITIPNI